jgi:hypothetical protein
MVEWVVSGKVTNLEQFATKAGLNKTLRIWGPSISALSPALYEAILAGNHSPLLTLSAFTDLSLGWESQRLAP